MELSTFFTGSDGAVAIVTLDERIRRSCPEASTSGASDEEGRPLFGDVYPERGRDGSEGQGHPLLAYTYP